jgi:hypothetical protein
MRTPQQLYAHERIIYRPEFLTCPHCGDLLVRCHYLAWDKTVQMLESRPRGCQSTGALPAHHVCRLAPAPAVSRGAAHCACRLHLWL